MASATPVISTHCGGPEDYVIEGKTGILVAFDAEKMASAIVEIIKNREKRNELGNNGRRFVEQHYSHDQFKKSFANVWQQTWGDQP